MLCLHKKYIDNPLRTLSIKYINRQMRLHHWTQIDSLPYSMKVPCNDCVMCRIHKTAETIGRLIAESYSHHWTAYFCTLTIEGDNVFDVKYDDVKPLTDAIRKSNRENGTNYRFYITSEYGSKTSRPHYHAMLYGFDGQFDCKRFILDHYKLGNVTCEPCSLARFRYTANAHVNKCSHIPYKRIEEDDDVFMLKCAKPFVTCSQKLGYGYYMLHADDIIRNGYIKIDGVSYPVPRTMMDKILRSRKLDPQLWRLRKYSSPDIFDSLEPYRKIAKKFNYEYANANVREWLVDFIHYLDLAEKIMDKQYNDRFVLKVNKSQI